jgi:hypothetical protein
MEHPVKVGVGHLCETVVHVPDDDDDDDDEDGFYSRG